MYVDQLLKKYPHLVSELSRIKKRVFVVGRFNPGNVRPGVPDIHLFTNRGCTEEYRSRFTNVSKLRYADFVDKVQPIIVERVNKETFTNAHTQKPYDLPVVECAPAVDTQALADESPAPTSYKIDTHNYFFNRAIETSQQPYYQPDQSNEPNKANTRALSVRRSRQIDYFPRTSNPGEIILAQIQSDLRDFCAFESRLYELTNAISKLFAAMSKEGRVNGAYSEDSPLPGGFSKALTDFLYAEDTRSWFMQIKKDAADRPPGRLTFTLMIGGEEAKFRLDDLDCNVGGWGTLASDDSYQADFVTCVTAFRAYLISQPRSTEIGRLQLKNGKEVSAVLKDMVSEDLRTAFLASRESFNRLRQVLRSKVLISMVLESVLLKFEDLPDVRTQPSESARHAAIETAILERFQENGLEPPVPRPSAAERVAYAKSLTDDFNVYLQAVFSDEANRPALITQIQDKLLRSLAEELEKDPQRDRRLSNLRRLTGYSGNAAADTTSLVKDICGGLFEEPTVTKEQLLKLLSGKLTETFRRAIQLEETNQDVIKQISSKHAPSIAKSIETTGKLPSGTASMVAIIRDVTYSEPAGTMTSSTDEQLMLLERLPPLLSEMDPSSSRGPSALMSSTPNDAIVKARSSAAAKSSASGPRAEAALRKSGDGDKSKRDLDLFDKALHLIYTRYNEASDAEYRREVEGMTLANLMYLFKDEVGVGRVLSSLLALVLDLVSDVESDSDHGIDIGSFLKSHSLTRYFDNSLFENGGLGYTALRNILTRQGTNSLLNLQGFVSELHGVKYLMETAVDTPEAEVIVINATASEFLEWVWTDNVRPADDGRPMEGHFQPERLLGGKDQSTVPAVAYLSSLAFPSKQANLPIVEFLTAKLPVFFSQTPSDTNATLKSHPLKLVLPPLCISGENNDTFSRTAGEFASAASVPPAPVIVVGPSPDLNSSQDRFATILPAGYLFLSHFLREAKPLTKGLDGREFYREPFKVSNIAILSKDRLRVIGALSGEQTLAAAIWPPSPQDYCFVADYFLYLVATLLAASPRDGTYNKSNLYASLTRGNMQMTNDVFDRSVGLDPVMWGGSMRSLSLVAGSSTGTRVLLATRDSESQRPTQLDAKRPSFIVAQGKWFDQLSEILGL